MSTASTSAGRARRRYVEAAGAVVWRGDPSRPERIEVALAHRPRYDDWSMPKGKVRPGEHVFVAAVREVAEEAGHPVALGRPLPSQRYPLADGRTKRVRYWAARADGDAAFTPDDEVDQVAWLGLAAARRRLTYPRDVLLLDALVALPLDTVPLVLLRHGSAVRRKDWRAAGQVVDGPRPLRPLGQAEARALAAPLRCLGLTRVVSSDARRCMDTIAPYLASTRVQADLDPAFSEAGFRADPAAARAHVAALADEGRPTLVCSHRPALPALMAALCERSGFPAPDKRLAPAAFWVAHLRSGLVHAVQRSRALAGN